MSAEGDRRIGLVFGALGAALVLVAGLLELLGGAVATVFGRGFRPFGWFDHGVILVAVGALGGFFALIGGSRRGDHGFGAGLVLVVLVVAGWLVLGLAAGLLSILGSVLLLVGGVLYIAAER